MQRLTAPGGLDDQDRSVIRLFHGDATGELRADILAGFGGIFSCPVPGGQLADTLAGVAFRSSEFGDPYPLADARLAVGGPHLLEKGCGGRVVADVVERLDMAQPMHVGLPGQDVDLERFPGSHCFAAANHRENCHEKDRS